MAAASNLGESLFFASFNGRASEVELLLQNPDIDPNYFPHGHENRTSLWVAAFFSHLQVIKVLLAHPKIDVNLPHANGATPLLVASENGHVEAVKMLLEKKGIQPNQCSVDGVTPLFKACQNGHVEAVKVLLKRDDLDINRGWIHSTKTTPIQQSAYCGKTSVTKLLLSDPRLKLEELHWSPLHMACITQDIQLFYWVISEYYNHKFRTLRGELAEEEKERAKDKKDLVLDLNQPDSCGITALHYVSSCTCLEILKVLLRIPDIDINVQDIANLTPLWAASSNGELTNVKWMLACSKNVRIEIKSVKGQEISCNKTAVQVAKLQRHDKIATLIEFYGANKFIVMEQLRRELRYDEELSSQILALIILYSGNYVTFAPFARNILKNLSINYATVSHEKNLKDHLIEMVIKFQQFLKITKETPLEIQMLISNFSFGFSKKFVPSDLLNAAVLQNFQRFILEATD